MKKILFVLMLVPITFFATAQEKRTNKHSKEGIQQHGKKHHHGEMMKSLQFSDAQRTQMKANRDAYKTKIQQLKQDPTITLKDYNEQKAILQKDQKARMQALLTPEQKIKLADMKAKNEQERAARYDKHFESMKSSLALTNDQANQLKIQHESAQNRMKAIRENESLSREDKRSQMKAIKTEMAEKRKTILTPEQQQKMENMNKEKRQKDWKDNKKES